MEDSEPERLFYLGCEGISGGIKDPLASEGVFLLERKWEMK